MRDVTVNCVTCGKEFTKRVRPNQKDPLFCSNPCKFKSYEKERSRFNCLQCGAEFERYVAPGDVRGRREFCSRSCQMKHQRAQQGCVPMETITCMCRNCGKEFTYTHKSTHQKKQFCSHQCSTQKLVEEGRCGYIGDEEKYARLERVYGEDEAKRMIAEMKRKRSEAITGERNPTYGKPRPEEVRRKISETCTGTPNALKGMTYEEFYGPERAEELGREHSEKLREGYASGRITPSPIKRLRIQHRGIWLKSKLELRVIEWIERTKGRELGKDLIYESKDVRVQWTDPEGTVHTYWPDLHDTVDDVVYEVKPRHEVLHPDPILRSKEDAAIMHFRTIGKGYMYVDGRCRPYIPPSR